VKAVVLCAGVGSRLLPHTQYMPKTLVPVCGRPILEYQIEALAGRVNGVILAAGYLGDQLEPFAGEQVSLVHNPEYLTTNSIYSLWLVRDHVRGQEFLLLNGDVLFDSAVLDELLSDRAPTALLVDRRAPLVAGEMNVVVRDGLVVEIGKHIPLSRANGQSLQMVRFAPSDSELLFGRIEELVEAGDTGHFPTHAYERIFSRSAMSAVQRRGGTWFEIDTVDDLARCEKMLGGC
jgi:L-glutamine-phosphate cytidylyltransferase